MGKRKEIKFLCKDGRTREGRQDGVMFWIRKDQKREQDGLPCYYVAANDTKGKGRTVFTGDHEYFTLEDAKELCQQIMAGEANLAERKARYAAGGQLYHEAHRLSVESLRERGMVEEVTTAMERRRQAHGRA